MKVVVEYSQVFFNTSSAWTKYNQYLYIKTQDPFFALMLAGNSFSSMSQDRFSLVTQIGFQSKNQTYRHLKRPV